MSEKKNDIGQLSTLTLVRLHTFPAQDHAAVLREFGLACFSAGAESAQTELEALRAKWETLRGECEAARAAPRGQSRGPYCGNECLGTCDECESLSAYAAARTLTDSTHAMEEE